MDTESLTQVSSEDTPLFDLVFQRIQKSQELAIPFSEYMELVLYDPAFGYYTRPESRKVGRKGDFFTSVSVGETFGFLLAEKIRGVAEKFSDQEDPLVIVEQGAHDGQLACDIVSAWQKHEGGESRKFNYRIVDPRKKTREWLRSRFVEAGLDKIIEVVASLEEAKAPRGIFLCNELLDAFPIRRLIFEEGNWKEQQVGWGEGKPQWVSRDLAQDLNPYAEELGNEFPEDYQTEVCPAMERWAAEAAGLFESGFWWIIDYGFQSDDYFSPHRKTGTLRCYRNHEATEDPFVAPGETDITAHVNFSHLQRAAESAGLEWRAYTDQHHFLIDAARPWLLAVEQSLANGEPPGEGHAKRLRQFQTLTHPGLMGQQFKIAELSRGIR